MTSKRLHVGLALLASSWPFFASSLSFFASSCSTIHPPPCSATNAWGVVHASTPAAAERLSDHLSDLAPRVVAVVPGLSSLPVDARFVERKKMYLAGVSDGLAPKVNGSTIRKGGHRWIELPEDRDADIERSTLAHELVHFWIAPEWGALPYFLEEGLADNVKDSLIPQGYAKESEDRALILSTVLFGGLALDAHGVALRCTSQFQAMQLEAGLEMAVFATDRRELPTVRETLALHRDALLTVRNPDAYAVMASYGYLLAARIGVERLHGLCLRARSEGRKLVPADWVLDSAGLPIEDREAWNQAILELHRATEGVREGRARRAG